MKFTKAAALILTVVLCGCTIQKVDDIDNYTAETAVTGNTSGNIANIGSACESNGVIYYQKDAEKGYIYKMSPDGSGDTQLNDTFSYFINVVDDTVYYVDGDDEFSLWSMSTDGSNKKKIYDKPVYYVNVSDDYIYFCVNTAPLDKENGEDYTLYKMDRNTLEATKLSDDTCHYVNVYGEKIYYSNWSDGNRLYSIKTDGTEKTRLTDEGCMYINAASDGIYYSKWVYEQGTKDATDKRIYFMDYKTGEEKCLNETESGDINVTEDKIYFSNWDGNNICRMNKDGSDIEIVSDINGAYINIAGGKLYFISKDKDGKLVREIIDIP